MLKAEIRGTVDGQGACWHRGVIVDRRGEIVAQSKKFAPGQQSPSKAMRAAEEMLAQIRADERAANDGFYGGPED